MAYFEVRGYVRKADGTPISGVKMRLVSPSGAVAIETTDYAGHYSFASVLQSASTYLLEPVRANATFTPASRTFIVDNIKEKDFTAAGNPTTYKDISGSITNPDGSTSYRITSVGSAGETIYAFTNPTTGAWKIFWVGASGSSKTITPSDDNPKHATTFTPTNRTVGITGDMTGIDFAKVVATPTGYSISGSVKTSGGTGVAGVTINCHNPNGTTGLALTDNTGAYTLYNKEAGSYIITAGYPGATVTPTTQTATVTVANVTGVDFVITLGAGYSVAGTLTGWSGTGWVAVELTNTTTGNTYTGGCNYASPGPDAWTTTESLPAGTYTVVPVPLAGGTWSTVSNVTITTANVTGINFTWTAAATGAGSIAGTVTLSGVAFEGVTIELRDGTTVTSTLLTETETASDGTYSFTSLANDTYTVVPVKSGYTFSPASRTIATSGAASTANDFTATIGTSDTTTFSVSGYCRDGSSTAIAGVLVTVGTRSGTSDSTGAYTVTAVPLGTYTVAASKAGYTMTANGFTNPVSVGYADVTGINWLGVATGGGGGGSTLAVPHIFTNQHGAYYESIDADKHNENNNFITDNLNNITDAMIAESAGIQPSKIDSSLGLANLEADILDMNGRIEEVLEVDPDFIKNACLPCDEDGIEINPSADGTIAFTAGKHLLMAGKRFELSATVLPEEGSLAPQSVYAVRARAATDADHDDDATITVGDLITYTVPLAGNALGSGDTGSTKYTVAEITGASSGSKLTISGNGTAPLLGALGVCLDDSYEKFFIAYQNGGTIMLADALGATPTVNSRIGICIDDPSYEDDPGSLGGVSTPSDALLAIVWQGSSGSAPYVQKVIPRNYETLGKSRVISSSWSERATITDDDDAPYDEVQVTLPSNVTAPIQIASIMSALYDTTSGDPTDATGIFFGPIASLALKFPEVDYPKGVQLRITPEKLIIRLAHGKLRILSGTAQEGTTAKSGYFKVAVLT